MEYVTAEYVIKVLTKNKISVWRLQDRNNNTINYYDGNDIEESMSILEESIAECVYTRMNVLGYTSVKAIPQKKEDAEHRIWGKPVFTFTVKGKNAQADESTIKSSAGANALLPLLISEMDKRHQATLNHIQETNDLKLKILQMEAEGKNKRKEKEPSAIESMLVELLPKYLNGQNKPVSSEVQPVSESVDSNTEKDKLMRALQKFGDNGFTVQDIEKLANWVSSNPSMAKNLLKGI